MSQKLRGQAWNRVIRHEADWICPSLFELELEHMVTPIRVRPMRPGSAKRPSVESQSLPAAISSCIEIAGGQFLSTQE